MSDAGKGDGIREDFDPIKFGENLEGIDLSSDKPAYRKKMDMGPGITRYVYGSTPDKFDRRKQFNENRKLIRDENGKLKTNETKD